MKWLKHLLWKYVTQDQQYDEVQVSCPEITIDSIDAGLHANLIQQATAAGAQFNGAVVTLNGLEFDWDYDIQTEILHLTCTKKPFYATCAEVESRIQELIAKAKGGI